MKSLEKIQNIYKSAKRLIDAAQLEKDAQDRKRAQSLFKDLMLAAEEEAGKGKSSMVFCLGSDYKDNPILWREVSNLLKREGFFVESLSLGMDTRFGWAPR